MLRFRRFAVSITPPIYAITMAHYYYFIIFISFTHAFSSPCHFMMRAMRHFAAD
jgi:hypothetical protein